MCAVISCPEISQGSVYTLTADGYTEQITMDTLVYGSGGNMGGMAVCTAAVCFNNEL